MDRNRLFEYLRRRRPTVDGHAIPLLPDMRTRAFRRDLKNRADFFTDVRELQTHPEVELCQPEPRFSRGKTKTASFKAVS
jgi:hypothetical protein